MNSQGKEVLKKQCEWKSQHIQHNYNNILSNNIPHQT